MMNKKENINKLIMQHYFHNLELGILYLNLSNQAEAMGMFNLAKYIWNLSNDKLTVHKDKIYEFIKLNRLIINGKMNEIQTNQYKTPKEIIELIWNKELEIRKIVNEFSNLCIVENDYETFHFLTWFVNDGLKDFNEIEKIKELFKLSNDNLEIDQAIKEII